MTYFQVMMKVYDELKDIELCDMTQAEQNIWRLVVSSTGWGSQTKKEKVNATGN